MKQFTLVVLLIAIVGTLQAQLVNKELLSAKSWEVKAKSQGDSPMISEVYQFQQDGTYVFIAGETKVTGKWSWSKDDEILLELKEIVAKGQISKFDTPSKYYIRVLELTSTKLRTLERHEKDAWDSGFAEERRYTQLI
jgi:hypothetical protein